MRFVRSLFVQSLDRFVKILAATVAMMSITVPTPTIAQDEFERPPISCSESKPDNAVERLQARLERFVRQTEECLICHGGSQTRGVPGHIVRSVYPDGTGQPIFSAGSHRVDHTTPFQDRWGGWYVTGSHGAATHLGDITYRSRPEDDSAGDRAAIRGILVATKPGAPAQWAAP